MNHGHDDFEFEPSPGLPAALPQGETLLWQGRPDWKALAIHAYYVRKVALYFLALMVFSIVSGVLQSHPTHDILVSCALLTVFGALGTGLLCALAYFAARSTVYSITSRRVLMRHGIAVPMTMNVPFKAIDGAALKVLPDGTGDIALTVPKSQRVGYLITWPHLRPGHITRPQPSFRALPDAAVAAEILSKALAAEAGMVPAELSVPAPAAAPREPRVAAPQPAGRTLGPQPTVLA